jgi:hypothetical protein
MSINNPSLREHEEQERMGAEALREEIKDINAQLANLLGQENYIVDREGNVTYTSNELLGREKTDQVEVLQSRLKDAYAELKKIKERT